MSSMSRVGVVKVLAVGRKGKVGAIIIPHVKSHTYFIGQDRVVLAE